MILFCLSGLQPYAQVASAYYEGNITHKNKKWRTGVEFVIINGEQKALVDFIDVGGYNRMFSVEQINTQIHLERPQPNGKKLIFDGSINGNTFSGKWSGIGIENAIFKFTKANKLSIKQEEISFINKAATISGTLLLPDRKGKFPVIIFMHGGAAEDRNVYYAPAMKFIKKGIAAFIYDKRGVGKSTGGDWQQDGLTALAEDAVAAVEVLKKREDIDAKHIAVFGHSEGGWTAPLAATISKDIAYVIVSGASSVPASEQTVYHRHNVMGQDGFDAATVERGTNLWKEVYALAKLCATDTIEALRKKQIFSDSIETVHSEPWFSSAALPYPYPTDCPSDGVMELLFKDPLPVWKKITVPVLAVWGERDIVVPVKQSEKEIKQALLQAGNKNTSFVIMPHINHAIVYENPTSGEWDFPREAPGYFERMVNWLHQQVNVK